MPLYWIITLFIHLLGPILLPDSRLSSQIQLRSRYLSLLLNILQWLPVTCRVKFNDRSTAFHAFHAVTLHYLSSLISYPPSCCYPEFHYYRTLILVPRIHGLTLAVPFDWNVLPPDRPRGRLILKPKPELTQCPPQAFCISASQISLCLAYTFFCTCFMWL